MPPRLDTGTIGNTQPTAPRGGLRSVRAWLTEAIFVLPIVAMTFALLIIPGVYALVMSLFRWNPGAPSPFVGVDNFVRLLTSERFHAILGNQAVLLLGVPLWTILPLAIAFLLHERVPMVGVFRTIFFFPAILSAAVVGVLFRSILAPDGLLNELLRATGLGALAQPWIDDAALVKPTLIVVMAWASLGLGVVVFSAALSSIRAELLEAAALDGASWWQRLRYVVLPGIKGTIVFWVAFQIIGVFLWTFGWIFVLTLGGPGIASTTIDFDIYVNAMRFGFFGLAAAESVILLVVVLLVLVGSRLILGRLSSEED